MCRAIRLTPIKGAPTRLYHPIAQACPHHSRGKEDEIAPRRSTQGNRYSNVRRQAKHHITWRTINTYTATYKAGKKGKGKLTIIVHALDLSSLTPTREFKTGKSLTGATKTFRRTNLKRVKGRVIIMAKAKTRKTKSTDEDLDETTAIEGSDELEEAIEELEEGDDDETTDEVDEDEDDDEDEDAPSEPKKSKKSKKSKPKQSRAAANDKVGTAEIAAKAGVDARTLRMVLRKHKIEKDEESGRYEWDDFEDKTVKKILKLLKEGAATEVKKESLDKLKKKKEEENGGKKNKKNKKNKKKKEVEEDEDDE